MPATVPSGCPKDGASWSQAGKADPNSMSGGRSSGTTPPSKDEKGKGLEIKGAGCRLTHVTTGNDDGSSTSTTYRDYTPAKGAGYCCSNGWGCEVTGRDGQKPIEERLHARVIQPSTLSYMSYIFCPRRVRGS